MINNPVLGYGGLKLTEIERVEVVTGVITAVIE